MAFLFRLFPALSVNPVEFNKIIWRLTTNFLHGQISEEKK